MRRMLTLPNGGKSLLIFFVHLHFHYLHSVLHIQNIASCYIHLLELFLNPEAFFLSLGFGR